ncbi:hypothetical protein HY008_02825 [Candidatus Woesebacteria bacterium]|nr:hypothetical protein [Candidatus Woesebacteria bacterium]
MPRFATTYDFTTFGRFTRFLPWVTGTILLLIFLRAFVIFVPPGFVGAIYDRGRGVLPYELHEGINILIPFWQSAQLFDTRIQEYTMSAAPDEGALRRDDSLDAPTSDG